MWRQQPRQQRCAVIDSCAAPCLLCLHSDVVLSVGDWCFSLWREGMSTPLLTSPKASTNLCSGRWSPTRPGVIFIAKDDGTIDIWDLLDQTHKPSLTTPVVSTPITSMEFRPGGARTGKQLLAVGDANGNLHVLEIPQQLRRGTANEDVRWLLGLPRCNGVPSARLCCAQPSPSPRSLGGGAAACRSPSWRLT